jgi:hypothetical protein
VESKTQDSAGKMAPSRKSVLSFLGSVRIFQNSGVCFSIFPSLSTQRYFSSSRDSLAAAYVNRAAAVSSTASELDLSRKTRRRDLRGRLKLPATVTLASSGCGSEPPLIGHWGHRGASGGGPGGTGKLV